jgi:hypothetical protein
VFRYWKERNLLLWIAGQNEPTALGVGFGNLGSCHLTNSFKKSTMTSETVLPSDRAFAFARAHSWSLTLTERIFFTSAS